MAWADTYTLLPLDQWAEIMGVDLWEFNQIDAPTRRSAGCDSVWFQHPWQASDFLTRDVLAQAIADAERQLADVLGYWPGPKYIFAERVTYPQSYDILHLPTAYTPRGNWKAVNLQWGRFISGGQLNRTAIDEAPVITIDRDGDGVEDRFELSLDVSAHTDDPDEIGVYFTDTDRLGEPLSEKWRIRPVTVTITSGTATISGHVSQVILPALQTVTNPHKQDPQKSIFVENLQVMRVFTDTTADTNMQGVAIWDVPPAKSGTEATPQIQVKAIQFGSRLDAVGRPYLTFGQPCDWPYAWAPDRVQANYLAGVPLERGRVPGEYARLIAYLATALLPSAKCGCEYSNRIIDHWRMLVTEGETGREFTQKEIDENPFGEPRRGALYAWKRCRYLMDTGAISL